MRSDLYRQCLVSLQRLPHACQVIGHLRLGIRSALVGHVLQGKQLVQIMVSTFVHVGVVDVQEVRAPNRDT